MALKSSHYYLTYVLMTVHLLVQLCEIISLSHKEKKGLKVSFVITVPSNAE